MGGLASAELTSAELTGDLVVPWYGCGVAVDGNRGRCLQHRFGHIDQVRRRDSLDLQHQLLWRRARAVRKYLPPDVLKEDGSALQVHQQRRLELVLGARQLLGGDGDGHLLHLLADGRHELAHAIGRRRPVHAEDADVVVEGCEDGRRLHEAVPVEDILVEARVHALAGAARAEGGAAAHHGVEHAERHELLALPARRLEREREMCHLVVRR
mmetsp:Transcript_41329/g.96624  ORF Transcript_41329/g.96624 Transcript_41329/m.96624 type:complete len:212 (+) Transcript_41329:179-814(+)